MSFRIGWIAFSTIYINTHCMMMTVTTHDYVVMIRIFLINIVSRFVFH